MKIQLYAPKILGVSVWDLVYTIYTIYTILYHGKKYRFSVPESDFCIFILQSWVKIVLQSQNGKMKTCNSEKSSPICELTIFKKK